MSLLPPNGIKTGGRRLDLKNQVVSIHQLLQFYFLKHVTAIEMNLCVKRIVASLEIKINAKCQLLIPGGACSGPMFPSRGRSSPTWGEVNQPVVETLPVGELLHDLLPLVEGQHAPPEDVSAFEPDGREQDARVQGSDFVVLKGKRSIADCHISKYILR